MCCWDNMGHFCKAWWRWKPALLGIRGWIRSSPTLITHDGSMVLLYMVTYGSHQYTPVMLAYNDPSWVMMRPIVSLPSRSIKSRPRHIVIPTSLLKDDATAPLDIWGRRSGTVWLVRLQRRKPSGNECRWPVERGARPYFGEIFHWASG